jgi:nicotinic acid phosphoribosyltransferase
MNPLLLVDSYKIHHTNMYPEGMTKLYSNFTPRKSRMKGVDKVVVFGIQHFILEYLQKLFAMPGLMHESNVLGLLSLQSLSFKQWILS